MATLNHHDSFYLRYEEPLKGCLLAIKDVILDVDPMIEKDWKYGMPFFCVNGKMLCYLWTDKESGWPYIGFADGNQMQSAHLIQGERKRMAIFKINPEEDIPVSIIRELVSLAVDLKIKR